MYKMTEDQSKSWTSSDLEWKIIKVKMGSKVEKFKVQIILENENSDKTNLVNQGNYIIYLYLSLHYTRNHFLNCHNLLFRRSVFLLNIKF